jgi:hypothetical protein
MYRSNDAERLSSNIGLENTGTIARVIVHPKDPNIVYVAVKR